MKLERKRVKRHVCGGEKREGTEREREREREKGEGVSEKVRTGEREMTRQGWDPDSY